MRNVFLFLICLITLCACDSPFSDTDNMKTPGNLVTTTTNIQTAGSNVITITNTGGLPITINKTTLENSSISSTQDSKDTIDDLNSNCVGTQVYPNQSCNISILVLKNNQTTETLKVETSVGVYSYILTIQTPDGDLMIESKVLSQVGKNQFAIVNQRNVVITLNSIVLKNNNTKDTINDISACIGKTLHQNESCGFSINAFVAESGTNSLSVKTNIGDYDFSIATNTPTDDIQVQNSVINSVGANALNVVNKSPNPVTINTIAMLGNNTSDKLDMTDCQDKTLTTGQTCVISITSLKSESGSDTLSINTSVGTYTNIMSVMTADNDLILDNTAITTGGSNTIHLVNQGNGTIRIDYLSFAATETVDTADVTGCVGKTLTSKQQCDIIIKTIDNEAGNDKIIATSSVGNYENSVLIDSTGNGVIVSDQTASISTTKEVGIKLYNIGTLPVSLKTFNLDDTSVKSDDSIALKDNDCEGKTLNAGASCEIRAKAVGGNNKIHYANFTTTNTYMKTQPVKLKETTDTNNLIVTANTVAESNDHVGSKTITLNQPNTQTMYIKNDGTNDMNVSKISLSNVNIGTIVDDTCTGNNVYTGEYCTVQIQVAKNAHGSADLVVETPQVMPNNKFTFTVNNQPLAFANGTNGDSMTTEIQKTFTVSNPNGFDVDVSNVAFNTGSYSVIENKCTTTISANGTCTFTLKSNTITSMTNITFVSDNFAIQQVLSMSVTSGISISSGGVSGQVFYQAFLLTNNGNNTGMVSIDNYSGGSFVSAGKSPELFSTSQPNCLNYGNGLPPQGTTCKYILAEDSSNPNAGYGDVGFYVTYSNGDMYSKIYTPSVTRHTVNIPATYQPNQTINATQFIQTNIWGIANSMATYVENTYIPASTTCNEKQSCHTAPAYWVSNGFILKTGDNTTTLNATFFFSRGVPINSSTSSFEVLNVPLYVSSPNMFFWLSPATTPALNNLWVNWYTIGGTGCTNNSCNIVFSATYATGAQTVSLFNAWSSGNFTQPVAAQNYTVVDSIIWNIR